MDGSLSLSLKDVQVPATTNSTAASEDFPGVAMMLSWRAGGAVIDRSAALRWELGEAIVLRTDRMLWSIGSLLHSSAW